MAFLTLHNTTDLDARIARVELLLLDVDGVLTDGSISYTDSGEELKRFHVRDGAGVKLWIEAGKQVAIVSGRTSPAVVRRAGELGIRSVRQGRSDKLAAFEELLAETGLTAEQVCAVGDDLADLPVLKRVGVPVAVADAASELRNIAQFVTILPGGHGAVRETIEWMLKRQGCWDDLIRQFQPAG